MCPLPLLTCAAADAARSTTSNLSASMTTCANRPAFASCTYNMYDTQIMRESGTDHVGQLARNVCEYGKYY
jgi:hypothetical protein